MHVQLYKRVKEKLLSLLSIDENEWSADEDLLRELLQDKQFEKIEIEKLRSIIFFTIASFQAIKARFSSCTNVDIIQAHERIMRFVTPDRKTEDQEYGELLGRYNRIKSRLVKLRFSQANRAEFELLLLEHLYQEADVLANQAGLWVVPDGFLGPVSEHDQVMRLLTQKHSEVGVDGVCYGITIAGMAELLKTGQFDREAFFESLATEKTMDRVAFVQDYQVTSRATDQQLVEVLEPTLLGQVKCMPGLLIKNNLIGLYAYARELDKLPQDYPVVILLRGHGVKGGHATFLYRDEENHWQLFDSNQMKAKAKNYVELGGLLVKAFSNLQACALVEGIYTVDHRLELAQYFKNRQLQAEPGILECLQAYKPEEKNLLLKAVIRSQDYELLRYLLKGGVNLNGDNLKFLMHSVLAGNVGFLTICLTQSDSEIAVSNESLRRLLSRLNVQIHGLEESKRIFLCKYIVRELKTRRILEAFKCNDLDAVYNIFRENPYPLTSKNIPEIKCCIQEIQNDEIRNALIRVFNNQNPDKCIDIENNAMNEEDSARELMHFR